MRTPGEIPAGSSVATLIFQVRSGGKTGVSILTEEVNALAPAYCETLEISYEHAHTEVRNGKEATCTEEGYTGDVYCTDCGQLVAQGEVIPALGHKNPNCATPRKRPAPKRATRAMMSAPVVVRL